MSDYTHEERDFIAMAKAGQSPTAQDKSRVLQLIVAAPLAAAAPEVVAGTTSASTAGWKATVLKAAFWKKAVVGAVIAGGSTATYYAVENQPAPNDEARNNAAPEVLEPALLPTFEPEPRETVSATPAISAIHPDELPSAKPESKAAKPKATSKAGDRLAAQVALLQKAQLALKSGDPASALKLAGEHSQQFPRSALANERSALRIHALCALNRVSQAQREAKSLLGSSSNSPMRAALKNSCASD